MNTFHDPQYPPYIEQVFRFTIPPKQIPVRLDVYLANMLPNATRSKVQEAVAAGAVTVNGQKTKVSRKIQPYDVVECRLMKPPPLELVPENIPLNICYEDDSLLVINKPAGLVVHPGVGHRYGTLVNAVLWHMGQREAVSLSECLSECGSIAGDDEEDEQTATAILLASDAVRPGIVHRLDKDTSGILVVAKHATAHVRLAQQFAERTAKRQYYALVWGVVRDDTGVIEGNIGRSPRDRKKMAVLKTGGKPATTEYTVIERFHVCTLLSLQLRTGRTHQIRVHCAHIHHPLVGDADYGGESIVYGGHQPHVRRHAERLLSCISRQALHAKTLGFRHPMSSQWMEFDSALPDDFQAALNEAREFSLLLSGS
ncbi:MAG: RluA family pseudouridine synthase [Bacteroidota bacterium]|nr:RluA family pseudouridine synthase [Candidatus Kapabacteria bacterium]MDW8219974.1 RluA family pseudouridine synthase [Bacteroidota bacterium]